MDNQIIKTCTKCGIQYTLEQWKKLHLVGNQPATIEGILPASIELRDCPCKDTLAISLDYDGNYYHETTEQIMADIEREKLASRQI